MTVYFVTRKGRDDCPVKIGTTVDLDRRLAGLQTGHHEELEVIASINGGRETESYLHDVLAASRIRGEWFQRTPEVEAAISRARAIGASSLPFRDAGCFASGLSATTDAADARAIVRRLLRIVAPGQNLEAGLSILCRRVNKTCSGLTVRRLRSLYNGEPRRIDAYEMRALVDLEADVQARQQDRDSAVLVPILTEYLEEVGAALSPDQQAIVDRYLQKAARALDCAGAGGAVQ